MVAMVSSSSVLSVLTGTFTKLRSGDWGVNAKGVAASGDAVDAVKRDGSVSRVYVDRVVWTNGRDCTLATFTRVAPAPVAPASSSVPVALAPAPVAPVTGPTYETVSADFAALPLSHAIWAVAVHGMADAIAEHAPRKAATAMPIVNAAPAIARKSIGRCARIDQAHARDNFVASQCACCGRKIDDPESVQCGMGPICRGEHGFDVADDSPAWGACLAALGATFPVDTYEEIVACQKRYRHAKDEDSRAVDAKRAVKVLLHRIAVADPKHTDGATVIRCVLAIDALGYKRLARVLGRALIRRPTLRDLPGAPRVLSFEVSQAEDHAGELYVRSTCDEWRLTREMRYAQVNFTSARGGWYVNAAHADRLLTIGQNIGDLVITSDRIINTLDMTDPAPVRTYWQEPCREIDREFWVDADGNVKRPAIPGEPASRPDWEKVPYVACHPCANAEAECEALRARFEAEQNGGAS